MKLAWAFVWPILKVVGGYSVLLVTGYITLDTWAINKAKTVVNPVRKEMMAVRDTDYEHFNERLNRVDDKLDRILKLVKE